MISTISFLHAKMAVGGEHQASASPLGRQVESTDTSCQHRTVARIDSSPCPETPSGNHSLHLPPLAGKPPAFHVAKGGGSVTSPGVQWAQERK